MNSAAASRISQRKWSVPVRKIIGNGPSRAFTERCNILDRKPSPFVEGSPQQYCCKALDCRDPKASPPR